MAKKTKPYAPVPRLYGAKEAAAALGVTPNNLDKIVGLPAPATEVAATRLWRADEIDAFAIARTNRMRIKRAARNRRLGAAA